MFGAWAARGSRNGFRWARTTDDRRFEAGGRRWRAVAAGEAIRGAKSIWETTVRPKSACQC